MAYIFVRKTTNKRVLNKSYWKVCVNRIRFGFNNSLWNLRFNWKKEKEKIRKKLQKNNYIFSPSKSIKLKNKYINCRVILKVITTEFSKIFNKSI